MKQSEYKKAILDRLSLLYANTIFTWQKETAYWANNWASVFSTLFYTVTMLVFINVVYANVTTFVGYTKQEMLFFFFMGQLTFYLTWSISAQNLMEFITDVNRGDLDLLLTCPIPALFYITFKRIRLFSILFRDGIPPTVVVFFAIDWSQLTFSFWDVLAGIILFFLGQICLHVVQFLATIPVIWLGESTKILKMAMDIDHFAGRFIPLEGFNLTSRVIFGVLIPVMIVTSFSTSVLLGKSDPGMLILWGSMVTAIALGVRGFVWRLAMRNYTSASS